MACFVCLEQLPARPLIFSFGSGVTFGPGRGTAGGCFVTPRQGVFLIRRVSCGLVCVPGTIACQTLDFFIRFRSDVWPGQRDGRRLFRHAVPGCFPDLKGVLWLGFCAWNSGSAGHTLDFFIRFRSDVWPGHRGGRRLFRHAVPGCFPDLKGVLWLFVCLEQLPARPLMFSFGSGVTFGPGRGTAGGCFVTPYHICFPDLKGVLWLVLCAWNNCLPDPLARAEGRQEAVSSRRARVFS